VFFFADASRFRVAVDRFRSDLAAILAFPGPSPGWFPACAECRADTVFPLMSAMKYASIGPIACYLPEKRETVDDLCLEFPNWPMDAVYEKTGVFARHIAGEEETASDMGVTACEALFKRHDIDPASIDFLLLCTQTPDYPLPTTACLVQDRLKLPIRCGALDFNLGCSGYVYGLAMADGLIRGGMAERVLLVTSETYSKYIDHADRSLRTIFGDGAAATLVEAADEPSVGPFVFGTDGSGGDLLFVDQGGARLPSQALKPTKRKRWKSSLYMDGPEIAKFVLETVPPLVRDLLEKSNLSDEHVDCYLMHQATSHLLNHLRGRMEIDPERMPCNLHDYGNTVSSTIPFLINDLRISGRLRPGARTVMTGFGVGLSWAGCIWRETWCGFCCQAESPRKKSTAA